MVHLLLLSRIMRILAFALVFALPISAHARKAPKHHARTNLSVKMSAREKAAEQRRLELEQRGEAQLAEIKNAKELPRGSEDYVPGEQAHDDEVAPILRASNKR